MYENELFNFLQACETDESWGEVINYVLKFCNTMIHLFVGINTYCRSAV